VLPTASVSASRAIYSPCDVVHVARDSAIRAAQETHVPLTVKVNSGVLWSVEEADRAA
jgi:hypothetical protein